MRLGHTENVGGPLHFQVGSGRHFESKEEEEVEDSFHNEKREGGRFQD